MAWPIGGACLGLMAIMAAAWAIHRATGNAGWIDALWTFGVGLCAAVAALYPVSGPANARNWIVASMVVLWSLRLGIHIAARNLKRPDDPRYAKLAADWGSAADRKLFWFLQQQAWCGAILIGAVAIAAHRPGPGLSAQDAIGATVVLVAILGEAIADYQLRLFAARAGTATAICTSGLWRFSRHPNYFFEWLVWLAFPIIAIDPNGDYPLGWLTLAAPALMYWLLVHVSGIPPLEEHLLASRGRAFEIYRARTNAFFPWLPRHP